MKLLHGLAAGALLAASAAAATQEPEPAGVEPIDPAETLIPLRFGSLTVYSENDKYFAGTDRNYTNGLKVSLLSTDLLGFETTQLPWGLRFVAEQAGRILDPGAEAKVGVSFGQNIYTPTDTQETELIPDDRPYAAWLYLGAAFHNYRPAHLRPDGSAAPARLDIFEVNVGVVGPWALGEEVQNGFHDLIGVDRALGWDNQIENEPGLNLIYERKWRWSTREARTGWGADFIPHAGLSVGNVSFYANAGLELRAGYALPADFGTSLIRPSGDSNSARPRFSFFAFLSTDGRAVARDITLDGNTFKDSHSVDKEYFVYDLTGGIGVGWGRMQLTYTQARRSVEFELQEEPQDFGSVSVSVFF